jgi:hypothetical protein
MKTKEPFIPGGEYATVRQAIKTLLERRTLSARDISAIVRIPGKEVLITWSISGLLPTRTDSIYC